MTKDEAVGWDHQLNGQKLEETPGDGEGQGNLACCNSWGNKELDMTEQLNNITFPSITLGFFSTFVIHFLFCKKVHFYHF